ncbi:prolyl oligopeptidase family serine peptidase [Pseudoneobacillus sp. C159]
MEIKYRDEVIENFHGTEVADPYRWLEDPQSPEALEWVKGMQKEYETYFADTEQTKQQDRERLTELWNFPKFFVPKKVANRLFYQKNDGLQNQAVLYVKELNSDGEKVLIDPNLLSEDGTVALTNHAISSNAEYIAYATSQSGSDWQIIRVRKVETGEELADHIQWVKFTSIAWSPDHSGFYYNRFPQPGTVGADEEGCYSKVYFHKIGTSQDDDILIHEQPEDKELMFAPFISTDEKYVGLNVFFGTAAENRVYVKPIDSEGPFIRLLDKQDAEYRFIANSGTTFYFKTTLYAPKSRIIAIDIEQPDSERWKEIVPEQQDVMDFVHYFNGQFVVSFLHNAHHQIHIYRLTGEKQGQLELPVIGSLTGLTGSSVDSEFYFGLTSFLYPTIVYRYDLEKNNLSVFAQSQLPFETDQYETNQIFYTSKDGTKVPMFLTHRKGIALDGQNPVILYGYGGFNISLTPSFMPAILRWIEKGGIYAVANLRGGAEYGEEWHQAGMLENKQNVFDDFIAAGEWLIAENYTSKEKLSIMGGSNGGLLVAACMVQRPDLYGAVICRVPVIDMLRYHKFTIGRFWIPEYGTAENPEHFPFLYAYSPLHNIREGETYPPVLIATAESDDRVVPAHAKKFAATLREKANQDTTIVLRLEAKAGHGLGKPTSKLIDEWVDFYAFLHKTL